MQLDRSKVSHRLYNEDIAPIPADKRSWGYYQVFAMWMSDIHSVGGYVFAASLFFMGLTGWEVLIALTVGICVVNLFINLMAAPGVKYGIPYAVLARSSFGVYGANFSTMVRTSIGIIWYGVQTWLASQAVVVLVITLWPGMVVHTAVESGFLGLSKLGWFAFLFMWFFQAVIFSRGIAAITKFIDFCGPAVYAVMFILAIWMLSKAGLGSMSLELGVKIENTGEHVYMFFKAIALVVAYFAALLLNFADFSRQCRSERVMKAGNFWGLPVNFVVFSLITVITTSSTIVLFGEAIYDPVHIVEKLPDVSARIIGCVTFIIATMGINIVANFVAPSYDLSNLFPKHISFRTGGFIASVISVLILPWNLFNNPFIVTYFVGTLGAFLGPIFGVVMVDYYFIKRQRLNVQDLYQTNTDGSYWYRGGWNIQAVKALAGATVAAAAVCILAALPNDAASPNALLTFFSHVAPFAWFIGAALGAAFYRILAPAPESGNAR